MMNTFNIKNTSLAPAVDRAMAILSLLAQSRAPQGVSDLARTLGIGKSSAHSILQALLAAEAIEDTGGRRFRLGPLVEELGRSRRGKRGLAELCQPHLAQLTMQTGQTSIFGVLEGDRFRIQGVAEGPGPIQVKALPGGAIPLLAGAVGKIALAWGAVPMPPAAHRFTAGSLNDLTALHQELQVVRREALALDRGEYLRGVYAAAAPVLAGRELAGILFAAGLQDQLGEDGLQALGRGVAQTAREVSIAWSA